MVNPAQFLAEAVAAGEAVGLPADGEIPADTAVGAVPEDFQYIIN
jgi:hypothetical protein